MATKRALLIGINYFGSSCPLKGCHDDVDNMMKYLVQCGYTKFTVLKDDPKDPQHKKADCPTKDNIIAAMKAAVAKVQPGDTLYVHYSGHGTQLPNRAENDSQDECICPVDFNYNAIDDGFIRDDLLNDILVKPFPAGAKLRVCFDSCHSGSALDLPCMWSYRDQVMQENQNFIDRDIVFISGCRDNQTSADSSFNGQAQGAMTWSLITALKNIKKSKQHATNWTWKELVQEMRSELRKNWYDQVPQLCIEKREQLFQFVDLI